MTRPLSSRSFDLRSLVYSSGRRCATVPPTLCHRLGFDGRPLALDARFVLPSRTFRTCGPRVRCLHQQQGGMESEGEWAAQLAPGSKSARRPQLQAASLAKRSSEAATLVDVPETPASGQGPQGAAEEQAAGGWSLLRAWDSTPAKYQAVFATSLSFVICNMDKVNISVAIIPMAQDFGWSPTVAGLVQSSFFYGYLLSQIPGGYLSSRLGGRRVLPAGVTTWSLATAAVPVLAGTIPGLMISRAAVGLGEGVAPSAATDIAARSVDTSERARAISFIFGGLHVGSLVGLVLAPCVIEHFGWPAVFYLFGGIGVVWSMWWERLMAGIAVKDPKLAAALNMQEERKTEELGRRGAAAGAAATAAAEESVPWRGFLRNRPLQALAFTHFTNNWFHYTMLAWLPTYFTDTLSLDLTKAAQVSILPPIAAIAVSAIAGPLADSLIGRGWDVATVRKSAQCMAFLGPAACLAAASLVDDNPGSGALLVGLVALSLGFGSFSLAGLYCNHADLSPRYAPVLLGMTNTTGALPGIIGVACTGYLYDVTNSWSLALFGPSILFFLIGSAAFVAYGSADQQDFDRNNQPFAFEGPLGQWLQPLRGSLDSAKRAVAGLFPGAGEKERQE